MSGTPVVHLMLRKPNFSFYPTWGKEQLVLMCAVDYVLFSKEIHGQKYTHTHLLKINTCFLGIVHNPHLGYVCCGRRGHWLEGHKDMSNYIMKTKLISVQSISSRVVSSPWAMDKSGYYIYVLYKYIWYIYWNKSYMYFIYIIYNLFYILW